MQIRQQILICWSLMVWLKAFHFCPPKLDNIRHALVIRGSPLSDKYGRLENALHARALLAARRIWLMAAVAIVVVEFSACCLLRIEPQFGVRLATFDIATGDHKQRENRYKNLKAPRDRIQDFMMPWHGL